MSSRGVKKRGRPPKVQVTERTKKFQYHLLKKPKYLLNLSKGSDSQSSTPTPSRASSPQGSEGRRSSTRIRGKDRSKRGTFAGSAYQRRGYNPTVEYQDSEYHYGSDFGDDSSDNKTDVEDDVGYSESDSEDSVNNGASSDSDFSLSGYSTMSGTMKKGAQLQRPITPEPLWLQNRILPQLPLPKSSDDLLIPNEHIMAVVSIYEVLRHFRNLVRLSPFRLEDFCACIVCEDQNSLYAEVHIMLLKALLREEDSQQTHFGPLDQKDSVNISLYLLDYMTWPEVLRAYVESDKNFDSNVLAVLSTTHFPFSPIEDKIKVLQFLTDQFLITNPVREDIVSEVPMHYDDHCRVCHKLGDLLCCETCPAVYHLECVDPPLVDVPEEDWQCNICRSHRVTGVVDCVLDIEKQGQLCRQEHLGCDRFGRKYYFLCRRIFVETDEGEIWYYTTTTQLEALLKMLDANDMEAALCREINEYKEEIVRHMELTEKLTNQYKGNKKSYLEVENAQILKSLKQDDKKEDSRDADKSSDDDSKQQNYENSESNSVLEAETAEATASIEPKTANSPEQSNTDSKSDDADPEKPETNQEDDDNKKTLTKTFNIDDLRRRTTAILNREDPDKKEERMTRLKSNQIANGTYLFKLGMENQFKSYVNQYATNIIALNKPQRNEERDKKRHLSHKFSLTTASEFKWVGGGISGSKTLLLNTLRQTILALEQSIQTSFMHPNWHIVRKHWLNIVGACQMPKDFAKALIVLQACIKPVVFANVWHEQLGHVKMTRITAQEREERKKIEKREKKEREEEEERNRMIISGYVKYTMGFKHQLWKQKGEEYRIHGRWGWLWIATARMHKIVDCHTLGLSAGPCKYMVQVRDATGLKILSVDPNMHAYITKKFDVDSGMKEEREEEKVEDGGGDYKRKNEGNNPLDNLKIVKPITEVEEIDVSKALTIPGRLLYPKVAAKSKLDDLLARRVQLKVLEEKRIAQQIKPEEVKTEDENIDVENDDVDLEGEGGLEKQLNNMMTGKVTTTIAASSNINKEILTNIAKKIQSLRLHYTSISKLAKDYACYSKGCNTNSNTSVLTNTCYSPLCLQRNKVRRELLALLRKANVHTTANTNANLNKNIPVNPPPKKSILEQKLTEPVVKEEPTEASICKDLASALLVAPQCLKEQEQGYIPKKIDNLKIKEEKVEENTSCDKIEGEVANSPPNKKIKHNSESDNVEVDMEIEENLINTTITTITTSVTTTLTNKQTLVDGVLKSVESSKYQSENLAVSSSINGTGRTIQTLNAKSSLYSSQHNRRFCAFKAITKREEKVIKTERAEDGTERVYSTQSTEGKLYLKRVQAVTNDKKKKRQVVKYPICSTFQSKKGVRSLLILPKHEVRRLARHAGRLYITGFNALAKPNNIIWPYPCARPLFKTCWVYRTVNLKSIAAAALQLRILWACLRWDDLQVKPPTTDGKHQITTETEILSLELLKHRHVGQFLEKTQYLRRKVVIPLELPKTVREVTSIRSGLRKRKRPESPQSTDPQVSEEWVDEDKLELWEIRQYGEKIEKVNAQVITRSRTGNLPPARAIMDGETTKIVVSSKATAEEIKEKMEQQLRLQRAAHQQKRALELKNPQGQVIKMVGGTAQAATTTSAKTATTNTPIQPKVTTADGQMKIIKNVVVPNQAAGKTTLTSLLTNSAAGSKFAGRRIFMTKAADGTTRVIAGTPILSKTQGNTQQSLIKVQTTTGQTLQQIQLQQTAAPTTPVVTKPAETPQKVQIIRGPDGRLTVKGLMPGQQLVQMPDGKLQVLTTTQIQPSLQQAQKPAVATPQKTVIKATPTPPVGKVIVQGSQVKAVVQSPSKPQQVIVKPGTPLQQKVATPGNVVIGGSPVIQQQVVVQGNQIVAGPGGQQIITNQIVVNNQSLAQQIATGKVQVATINGQQVLIRPTGNNQAQIVAQLTPAPPQQQVAQPQPAPAPPAQPVASPVKNVAPPPAEAPPPPKPADNSNQIDQNTMDQLLAGQPPGTVIKCVTAQVIQTAQGPRIVLQGLQGADFTAQQLAAVQQQVKQQLLKAQASTGKQGVLGPTKIYLAVQPSGADSVSEQSSQPPPLAPVQTQLVSNPPQPAPQKTQLVPSTLSTSTIQSGTPAQQGTERQVLVNGQQTSALLQAMRQNMEANQPPGAVQASQSTPEQNKQFVVTPDYIQQTIKTALKQENLNPEIEEKLLQLQRYQEKQMKHEPEVTTTPSQINNSNRLPSSRKRPPSSSRNNEDSEWVLETPKRSRPSRAVEPKKDEFVDLPKEKIVSPRSRVKLKEVPVPTENERKVTLKTKIMVSLFRHKEMLKKDILRKRALLEKELQFEIQKDVAEELAARTKLERTKQDEVRTGSSKRKSAATTPAPTPVYAHSSRSANKNKKGQKSNASPPSNTKSNKKEKLYCICRTPYDETKFYVGCDLCNNWFHGDCVGITEESSKTMSEFICTECQHARDTQELFCLCKQPYDASQFYICCDRCQDWFHGRCVGILQSEAEGIDEYICPNCQENNSVNFANMKELSDRDFDGLRKLIKQIQSHKSAWPFMEPVDPTEAPDYYKVIKEPMDLQKIENKINEHTYNKLSEFIGDMTKIFDNCRYYNPKESQFYKCAESLEAYFVNKIKFLREKLFENNK